jgi:hypothetical protein
MNTNKIKVIPRTSFSLFIIDVPYLRGKELSSAVRNQIVGLFPGNLEEYVIEIKKTKAKDGHILFLF